MPAIDFFFWRVLFKIPLTLGVFSSLFRTMLQILARAKQIDGQMENPRTVMLDASRLAAYFGTTLQDAAKKLGVCATSLKR